MRARHIVLGLVLSVWIAGALGWSWRRWRGHQRRTVAVAAVAPVPPLERWPAGLADELNRASTAVMVAADPVGPLEHLAAVYVANGRVAEADAALQGLRRLQPDNGRWCYWQAAMRLRAGDEPGAEAAFAATAELAADYAPAWLRLGDLQQWRGATKAALQSYTRATEAAPSDPAAQYAVAALQADAGSLGDPRSRLAQLARWEPEAREVHLLLARVLAAAGEPAGAAAEMKLAAKCTGVIQRRDPWLDEIALLSFDGLELGRIARDWVRGRHFDEAEALLKRAIELRPGDAVLRQDLARTYRLAERTADARETLQVAVAACPAAESLPADLAEMLRLEHKAARALDVARAALRRWPDDVRLREQVGLALKDLGEPEAAATELRQLLALDPTRPDAHYALAFCLLALRDPGGARAAAEEAIALNPDHAEARVMLAGMAIEAGDIPAAERHVMYLHELQPDEPGSRLLYAGLHLIKGQALDASGDLEGANRLFRTGLRASPDFAPLVRETAMLAVRRAQFEEAVELFERYLRLEPKQLETYVSLGDALNEIGREQEARMTYERGLAAAQKMGDRQRITELSTRLDR